MARKLRRIWFPCQFTNEHGVPCRATATHEVVNEALGRERMIGTFCGVHGDMVNRDGADAYTLEHVPTLRRRGAKS